MEQSKNTSKQLDQMQMTFVDLAQQVHHIRAAVDDKIAEVDEPPFDGDRYVWNWKGITILFVAQIITSILLLTSLVTYLQHVLNIHSLFTNFGLLYIHSLHVWNLS